MASFAYKGRTKSGDLVTGTLDAANVDAVARQLQAQLILPVEIKEEVKQKSGDIDLAKLLPPPTQPITTSGVTFTFSNCFFASKPITV